MLLRGSCHCGKVSFEVESREPVPYQRCYCSICRKTGGGGGYLINLGAQADTLKVRGEKHVRIYRAMLDWNGKRVRSRHQRHFCGECGSHLWAFHPDWPELVHPVASAIDTDLPVPARRVHMMLGSKANWVEIDRKRGDEYYPEYSELSLREWHEREARARRHVRRLA